MRKIKDRDVHALHAFLQGRTGEVLRVLLMDPLNRTFAVLVGAAFNQATFRRFPTFTHGDIVRYVAKVRGHHREIVGELDPLLAEYLILQAAGVEVAGRYGKYRRLLVKADLLRVLVEELNGNGVEELLGQARALADEWLRNAKR